MEVEIVDRQRTKAVATRPLLRFARALWRAEPPERMSSFTVALVGDRRMRALNKRHRGVDRTTDVLAFPDGEGGHLGDVAISVPRAAAQAREAGHSLACELRVLMVHGYLHLLGYDHETDDGRMMRRQTALVRGLVRAGSRP